MSESRTIDVNPLPSQGLVNLAHLIYALHAFALVSGILTSATIVGSFVSGLPSIVAVILNYVKRDAVRGTWLDSHFRWQIRTFWLGLLWVVVGTVTTFIIVGWFILLGVAIWYIYRVVRGALALNDGRAP